MKLDFFFLMNISAFLGLCCLIVSALSFNAVFCSSCNDLKIVSKRLKSARGMLMNNLQASMTESKGLPVSFVETDGNIKNLPIDYLVHLCKYLDLKSIIELVLASKYSQNVKKYVIKMILSGINGHFVFKEDWFNEIFYSVIESRIPTSIDVNIHDFVMLLIIDHIKNCKHNTLILPRSINLAIISFINNIVNGPSAVVPLTLNDWIYSLGEIVQNHSLPLSLKYFEDYENVNCFNNSRRYYPIIEFIALHCRKPEDFALYPLPGDIHDFNNFASKEHLGDTFDILFKAALLSKSEFNVFKSIQILWDLYYMDGYPLEFLDKIVRNKDEAKSLAQIFKWRDNAWFCRDFFRITDGEVTDDLSYMWSCDFSKPFSIEEAQQYPDFDVDRLLFELCRARMPFLLQYDILSKFFEANLVSFEAFNNIYKLEWSAVDLFLTNPTYNLSFLINTFNRERITITKDRFEFILERISEDNHLALLLFQKHENYLTEYKALMSRKNFILNVEYTLDIYVTDLFKFTSLHPIMWLRNWLYTNVSNKLSLTFKEILAGIDDPYFYELFGLDAPEDRIDNTKITTVHSLRHCLENLNLF